MGEEPSLPIEGKAKWDPGPSSTGKRTSGTQRMEDWVTIRSEAGRFGEEKNLLPDLSDFNRIA